MSLRNSDRSYGVIARVFHWLTALLIFAAFPVGFFAAKQAEALTGGDTSIDISSVTQLFSLHKTIGVAVFFVALGRILWAVLQPKPQLLHGDRHGEAWLAETIHWLLYGSLVLVPLSGWIHHAASEGFAPIWWPLGQNLPLVPKSHVLSDLFSGLHFALMLLLAASLALHIAGTLKHHVVDRDSTLLRMLRGDDSATPSKDQPSHLWPALTAAVVFAGMIFVSTGTGLVSHDHSHDTPHALDQVDSDWQVTEGSLTLAIQQMGAEVTGRFDSWTAEISYDPDSHLPEKGHVKVSIAITSLQLGSVSDQAQGPDYFDSAIFPNAEYSADLIEVDNVLMAQGSLRIKDTEMALTFPVELTLDGQTAQATGAFTLDRRSFGIGDSVPEESTLGFLVPVQFALTAERQ